MITRILLPSLIVVTCFASTSFAEPLPREVAVSSEAWAWVAPDTVRFTVAVSGSGADASTALQEARTKTEQIRQALKKAGTPGQVSLNDRGYKLTGGDHTNTAITSNRTVNVQSFVGVEAAAVDKVDGLIDAALKAGAQSVADVEHLVRNVDEAQIQAVKEATKKGRTKAEAVAKSLGAKLGGLLSVVVTEQSEGRRLRLQRREGKNLADYSDKDLHVIVSLRYEIAS